MYKKINESDAIEMYNDMLDEIYPELNIAGYSYQTSVVLKRVDLVAYNTGFNDWLDSMELEIENE